jgi:hypothetical protein
LLLFNLEYNPEGGDDSDDEEEMPNMDDLDKDEEIKPEEKNE